MAVAVTQDKQAPARPGLVLETPLLLRERIARAICQAIVSGTLKPGERLVETKLATELGSSRNPVREALQQLEQQGIVVSSIYKGVRVADIGPQQIEEVYSLRAVLESFVTRRAAERGGITPQVLEGLEALTAEMERAAESADVTQMVELDMSFHDRITECAGHSLVVPVLSSLRQHVRIIIALSSRGSGLDGMIQSHRMLLDVLRSGDLDAIENATKEHILESGALMTRLAVGAAPAADVANG